MQARLKPLRSRACPCAPANSRSRAPAFPCAQDMASWVRDGIGGLQSVVLYSLPELDGAIDTGERCTTLRATADSSCWMHAPKA